MAFQEKSAWMMSLALLLAGAAYFYVVAIAWDGPEPLAPPMLPLVIAYTVGLVVMAIVGHIAIALWAPKEANARPDERERQIFNRAGHYASVVLASGIVLSLGQYLMAHDGHLLFYTAFASLMIAQIMEYAFQILFYRTRI